MSTVDNLIQSIDSESKTSKAGKPFKIWRAELDDGRVIKFGFNKPKYTVGQRIVGSAVPNRFGDLEFVEGGGEAPSASTGSRPSAPAPAPTGRTFPVPPTSPETSIIRQNALTNANAAVAHYFETVWQNNDSEPAELPRTCEDYVELVIQTAYKFTEFSSGQREVKRVKAMTE
jgi:hypothetical protein